MAYPHLYLAVLGQMNFLIAFEYPHYFFFPQALLHQEDPFYELILLIIPQSITNEVEPGSFQLFLR